jgi:hypothetical protein
VVGSQYAVQLANLDLCCQNEKRRRRVRERGKKKGVRKREFIDLKNRIP